MVRELLDSGHLGFLRFLHVNGTSNILLALQMERFIDDGQNDGLPLLLRQRDLENVNVAIEIVKADMRTTLSVKQLAPRTGTTAMKLQKGHISGSCHRA